MLHDPWLNMIVQMSDTGRHLYDNTPFNPHDLAGTISHLYGAVGMSQVIEVTWSNGCRNTYRSCDLNISVHTVLWNQRTFKDLRQNHRRG